MNRFADLRKKAKLNQEDIAAALGVDRSTVAKWETGVAFPRGDKLPAVAKAYRCEIKDLFDASFIATQGDAETAE
jgi:transcriptional regulator with XRE-family HTH domain